MNKDAGTPDPSGQSSFCVSEEDRIKGKAPVWEENAQGITVSGKKFRLVFDKNEGIMKQYRVKGKELIDPEFGLRPIFYRAWTDIDPESNG